MLVPLWKIAHARSGDKADRADIGLFAYDAQSYAVLKREVTRERLAAHFATLASGPVELWALDNLLALKIVLNGALQGGALDPHGQPRQECRGATAAHGSGCARRSSQVETSLKDKRRKQSNGNRRGDLLRVCARLFREKGFDGTTIRDISRAAGMHSGSPFYHFASKQEMLLAVMEQGLAEGLRRSEAVLAERLPPEEKFRRLVRAHLGTILEDGNDFIPVLLYDWRSLTPANRRRVIALKDRYDAVWQRLLDELEREGHICGDAQVARLLVLGAVNWAAQWYRPGGRLSLDEIAAQAAGLFLE